MHADDRDRTAGHEVAELVEDPVVRQVMLGITSDHLALVDHRGGVLRLTGRPTEPRHRVGARIEEADHDRHVAETRRCEISGQPFERPLRRGHEGAAQHQVLRRIAGQRHLRQENKVRTRLAGCSDLLDHTRGVARQIADRDVDLRKSHPQPRHTSRLGEPVFASRLDDRYGPFVRWCTPGSPVTLSTCRRVRRCSLSRTTPAFEMSSSPTCPGTVTGQWCSRLRTPAGR